MYRLGSKDKLAKKIIQQFPTHSIYIEPFFGIGGLYFNKVPTSINLLNDLDDSVHSFWYSIKYTCDELINTLIETPITETTFNHYKNLKPQSILEKAIQFVYVSSFSLFGAGNTLMQGNIVQKESVLDGLKKYLKTSHIQKGTFYNQDFRKFLKTLTFVPSQLPRILIYNDPPYLGKMNNYNTPSWTQQDLIDLIELNLSLGVKFCISEFYNETTKGIFESYNLNILSLGERRNVLNIEQEILVSNYSVKSNFLDII